MTFDPYRNHRRSIRLQDYDYAQAGAYFVTICVQGREHSLGEVADGGVRRSGFGEVVARDWQWLAAQYPFVELDTWIIMPDHLHAVIVIMDEYDSGGSPGGGSPGGGSRTAPTAMDVKRKTLGRLVGAFKTVSTKHINLMRDTPGAVFWQRNYYERIIRDEKALQTVRRYIENNPRAWLDDINNTGAGDWS